MNSLLLFSRGNLLAVERDARRVPLVYRMSTVEEIELAIEAGRSTDVGVYDHGWELCPNAP